MLFKKDAHSVALERGLSERLDRYAQARSVSREAAAAELLTQALDQWEEERENALLYCPNCHALFHDPTCPRCGRKWLEPPTWSDHCWLAELEPLWAGVLEGCLKDNHIPYVAQSSRSAAITAKMGTSADRKQFFVRYDCYDQAKLLLEGLFSGDDEE